MVDEVPMFEGRPVDGTVVKMSGAAPLEEEFKDVVLGMDDYVQMLSSFRVIGVNHMTDKDGKLIRIQTLKPVEFKLAPIDPDDPDDIGVIRALPLASGSTTIVED